MKQYLELCQNILDNGEWKEPARENMPRTLSLFGTRMEFDLRKGFPLLTTKKMYYKGIITELLWFIKSDTNIKYLVDNGCNIWNQDAYRWYLKKCDNEKNIRTLSYELFINYIKNSKSIEELTLDSVNNSYVECPLIPKNYTLGDLGNVYGHNWRNQNSVDQLKVCVDNLLNNPMGRYPIIDAWNPSDWGKSALMPCHLLYQFNCGTLTQEEKVNWVVRNTEVEMENLYIYEETLKDTTPKYYLDLQLYQRSCDTFLGNGFNITSASIFLHLMGKLLNMIPRKFIWVGGDTHIYENHIDQVKLQLTREPLQLPKLTILKDLKTFEDLINLEIGDIIIEDYISHPTIKGELKTGL